MLNTFSIEMIKPISKLLVKSNKNGKKLIGLLLDAWDNEEVYQPRTGLSDEDFKVLSDLMDEHTSDLVKVIDRQEHIIRDEYEGMYQEEFEDILSEMKTNLQHLKNSKNTEMTDALIADLSALYHNMGDIVREVIQVIIFRQNYYLNQLKEDGLKKGLVILYQDGQLTPLQMTNT